MKFKKLLVLSALWLMASGVMAAIVDGVRQKPLPSATQGFVASESTDTYYYLYNVDAKGFFTEGNAWGTQVSIGEKGLKVAFIVDPDYPDAYQFNDFSLAKNSWKLTVFDNEGAMFVDLGNQANYRWGVQENGDTFRLFAASDENGNPGWDTTINEETGEETEHPAYREGLFMGWDSKSTSTACVPYLDESEGHCINWAFVTEEVYTAYAGEIDIYESAQKLKKALDDAKAKGFNETAEYDALYINEAATKAELDQALTKLNDAIVEWGKTNASVENPADMTVKIVNPHFDNGDCTTGWSGDAFGRGGTVSDGAEHYNKNYDTYQTIKGLTPGVYAVGVYGYYRAGNYGGTAENHWVANDAASKNAKLYAKVGEAYYEVPIVSPMSGAQAENQGAGDIEVTYTDADGNDMVVYVPNTMATGDHYIHTLNQYANKLYVVVDEAVELTIGVKKGSQIDGDWSFFDDFSLTYYGSGADAAKLYLDETLSNYSEKTIDEGTIYTKSYLEAYNEALKTEISVSSLADVVAALSGIDAANKAIDNNIQLWKDWQALVDMVKNKYVIDSQYSGIEPEIDDLADYVDELTVSDILDAAEWTNEELQAEMDKVNQWVKDLVEKSKLDVWDGKNMTNYITNPGFDDDKDIDSGKAEGWTIDAGTGGNITRGPLGQGNQDLMQSALGEGKYFCFEGWHRYNWDVWQEIENLPVGMYELQVQGYVRCEMSGYNRGDELEGEYASPVYLYMNNAMSQFPSVYSQCPADEGHEFTTVEGWTTEEINGNLYPNSMGGAAQCFGWDMYKTTAYGLIAKDGDKFRVGVKMTSNTDWWCIWDSFKLTYRKPTADIVKPALEDALKNIDTSKAMGKNLFAQADEIQKSAADVLAGNDGDAMFAVLTQVYDLTGDILASVEKFNKLSAANLNLENAIFDSESSAVGEAKALMNQINDGIENHTIDDAEVDALINEIELMLTKLNLPDDMAQASDNDPKECTGVIKSASFQDADFNSSSAGWTNPGNLGNDDTQKGALAIEFWETNFDMYQTVKGLPKGTYMLTVNAWCRIGDNQENYDAWTADNATTMAFVYAVDGDSTVYSAPIANVMKGAMTESYSFDGEQEFTVGDVIYYLPGSLLGGRNYMDDPNEGVYTNSVICKVGDDGLLTVGIKKDEKKTSSWVVCDDFKLYYLGANSSQQPGGDPSSVNAVATAPVKVEFYNLNGSRINKNFKGIAIQKQTLRDGSVKVQKVTVK